MFVASLLISFGATSCHRCWPLWGLAVASRYTNIIFLPALMAFFTMMMAHAQGHSLSLKALRKLQSVWISHLLAGALAVGVAVSPMLIKNWLLVGCPLTPHIGCQDTYWAGIYGASRQNLTVVDLLFYPFVWTFASPADMLGNISRFSSAFCLFSSYIPFLSSCKSYISSRHIRSYLLSNMAAY